MHADQQQSLSPPPPVVRARSQPAILHGAAAASTNVNVPVRDVSPHVAPPQRMISQTLANYIAFPFPFARKHSAKPSTRRSSAASSYSGSSAADRRAAEQRLLLGGTATKSDASNSTKKRQPPLPAALLVGYVGEYWHKTPRNTFMPLSLVDLCVRSMCMRLIHDPETALYASESTDEPALKRVALPTELAASIVAWLKAHGQLERERFALLAPFLSLAWDLRGVAAVDDSWFDELATAPLEQLRRVDVTGCHQLRHLVGAHRGAFTDRTETLPSLTVATFAGCTKLSPSVVDLLQFSPFLVTLNLAGCRNVDDRNLLALRRLVQLETLDLSGCRLVTDAGMHHLAGLAKLETLVLSRCVQLTAAAFATFAAAYPKLRRLDAAHCRIADDAMEAIGAVESLETLVVRGCTGISDLGLAHLAQLEQLQYFDARHCDAVRALPTTWCSIRVLLLARTAFSEADAAVLQHMPQLRELDLRTCRILKRSVEFICRLPQLKRLVLAETALTDAGLIEICTHCLSLKALDIASTEVTDAGAAGLARLKALELLNLDTPGVSNRALASLSSLPRLTKLDLFGANITDNGLLHLVPLRRLRELDVCGGNISDRGVELIGKITTLTSLNLSQNRNVRAKSVFYLRTLTALRYLNLSNTSISALSLRHLTSLKELETLSVYGCTLSTSHIDELRDLLPALKCLRCA